MPDVYKGAIHLIPANDETYLLELSPFGRKMKIEDIQQVREERTASGKLVRDIISTKKKITITYTEMDGADLDALLFLYSYQGEVYFRNYYMDDSSEDYTCFMEPISRERVLLASDDLSDSGLWANIEIVLNEV